MSSLIVILPSALPTASTPCSTVWTEDGSTAKRQLDAPLNLLPQTADAEIVVVVPAAQLSWHRVDFPKGTLERGFFQEGNAPRLRAVLDGLLEDRLLDEPAHLHFAIQPQTRADAPNWVAACNRAWLHAWLAALEQNGRPVARIVPELAPPPDAAPDAVSLNAMGTAEQPQLVCSGPYGVVVLPLTHNCIALLTQNIDASLVLAEPAVAALAEQHFSGRVSLQTAAQRAMTAVQSAWDLAQFDLLRTRGTRTRKQLTALASDLLQSPRWKPARWAAIAIVLANLIGLQAWAWKEQAALAAKRTALREILTMTFPDTRVVVDAPLQMARSLADLQRQSGAASSGDLETMLGTFQAVAPEIAAPIAIEFVASELRMKLADPSATTLPAAITRLQAQGYSATHDGDRLVLRQQDRRP
nr:type II secretion system protein GspL [Rhodoferax sp.]